MSPFGTITLLINALTLALSLGFLLIVLWNDARKELNQFFGVFLVMVVVWNVGSLLGLVASLIEPNSPLIPSAVGIMEVGFTGSSIAAYALTAVLVGVHTRRFRWLAFSSLFLVLGYQIFLFLNNAPSSFTMADEGLYQYRFQPMSALLFLGFDFVIVYLIWNYRRKIRSRGLLLGLHLFVVGQSFGLLNPELRIASLSINICAVAALLISFAILRLEIISPLAERILQVEAVHKVSLAISSHIALETVLNQIAIQAAGWLEANAAGIFLKDQDALDLTAVYDLPAAFIHAHIPIGQGVAGRVAETQRSIYLENYGRDWKYEVDLPLARETFGSVICVPLVYSAETIGVLMVIAGLSGRLFKREDVQLLELLGAQAAVAIAHSRLFAEQEHLARQVEASRSQLETVLISTENPVIAVDRRMRPIFTNPAARELLQPEQIMANRPITRSVPHSMLPPDVKRARQDLRQNRVHVYEIAHNGKIFLCHLAQLGRPRATGWVAVLNDVTELKELDRLKSEMVRMTSHDLKNPLQAAFANLELLSEDLAEFPSNEVQLSLTTIHKQLTRMNRIISGILDLERVKDGVLTTEICSPEHAVMRAVDDLRHLADDRRIEIEMVIEPNLPNFEADPDQFDRALANVVENAIKFTSNGGRIAVQVDVNGDCVRFTVSDTGIGIPQELHPHVFERFWRGAQKGQKGAEHITGTGLGLSLVKTIVENHGGKIHFVSQEGLGTTFVIEIPALRETV
jgi:signal transduction histidine kinase